MNKSSNRSIIIWLLIVCIMVFTMVMIGGITRLTDSGLSMVDWKPIMGAIPPITETEWLKAFSDYKNYPEYQKINSDMTLSEFKSIFFWEYFHRLFGRLIGMAFFFPYLYFLIRKRLDKKLNRKLIIAFILGGMQGLMGWYMVKSGLVDRPDVSHFRLAAHLGLAFLIIGYIFWILFPLAKKEIELDSHPKVYKSLKIFLVLIGLQIIYGAFVAGLDAGLAYNTFPKMGSKWIADSAFVGTNFFNIILENNSMIQFIHRTLGWIVFIYSVGLLLVSKNITNGVQKKSLIYVFVMVFIQFLLGISTLIMLVPISLAVAHQLGACLLLILTLNAVYNFLPKKK
jgi:cytochrome c oxidase assembly protein subunit 15